MSTLVYIHNEGEEDNPHSIVLLERDYGYVNGEGATDLLKSSQISNDDFIGMMYDVEDAGHEILKHHVGKNIHVIKVIDDLIYKEYE